MADYPTSTIIEEDPDERPIMEQPPDCEMCDIEEPSGVQCLQCIGPYLDYKERQVNFLKAELELCKASKGPFKKFNLEE